MADSTTRSSRPSASDSVGQAATARVPVVNVGSPSTRPQAAPLQPQPGAKKRRNRRGKRKKRKQSFAFNGVAPSEDGNTIQDESDRRDTEPSSARQSVYRVQGRNLSMTSIESEALLDHRDQQSMRPRRSSTANAFGPNLFDTSASYRPSYTNPFVTRESSFRKTKRDHSSDEEEEDERAPLIAPTSRAKSSGAAVGYGSQGSEYTRPMLGNRRPSSRSSARSKKRTIFDRQPTNLIAQEDYNINDPPSVPQSPQLGATSSRDINFGDMLMRNELEEEAEGHIASAPGQSPSRQSPRDPIFDRRHTIALEAREDVCFPIEGMSELAEEDIPQQDVGYRRSGPRRRRGKWPDLPVLEDWSRFEKEGRSEERRSKKITEPQLIGGRLRPTRRNWYRSEDDAPYRFTYFNEEFQSTIHSQTISELVQPGGSFQELFIPDPPELSDSSSEDDDLNPSEQATQPFPPGFQVDSVPMTRQSSLADPRADFSRATSIAAEVKSDTKGSSGNGTPRNNTPLGVKSPNANGKSEKPKRYGERPTWWLDVLSPTEAEMKVLSKTFGIHPLTAEDIIMQETREKVELFRHYYFVSYRSFEQDVKNDEFLEPVNIYVVVFREGVISFHFSMTPHPANVRRRIRQLKDYLILSSDWISYAIIDDITDAFAPLIERIEEEVDDIDDAILKLHSTNEACQDKNNEKADCCGDGTTGESGGDMLRRVGDCRKRVMGLYRLLGNKADVIKGFAKRCNEHWQVAPRSEIGLYLGDIQDHIVTMTGNLSHYEKILARSHGNYLAQINIRMNERQEETADVLGKLTVLGTIVLPMNIITGLWGMNVWVPGQDAEGNLTWFWCITAGLAFFGIACFYIAKLLYRIV